MINIFSTFLKLLILVLIFQNNNINSLNINEAYPSAFLLSDGNLFLVTENGLRIYDSNFTNLQQYYNFESEYRITSENEAEKTAIAEYPDGTVIALVKNILYILNKERSYIKKKNLSNYFTNGIYYSLIAYNYDSLYYYYVIAYSDNGKIIIKYFNFSNDTIMTRNMQIDSLSYKPTNSQGQETCLRNYGLSCGVMIYNESNVVSCFYQLNSPDELGVSSYYIKTTGFQEVNITKKFSSNNQTSIIKSVMSPDKKIALICHNKYYSFSGCLKYDIATNEFTSEELYFNYCKGKATGLYVYYFPQKNEYMFICSNNADGFNAVVFDSNFTETILNSDNGRNEPYLKYGSNCYYVYNFNIVYLSTTDKYILINDCDIGQVNKKTGSINLEELSRNSTSVPKDGNVATFNNTELIQELIEPTTTPETTERTSIINSEIIELKTNVTKENLIENLPSIINEIEIGKIYQKVTDDFSIFIYPTNSNELTSTTHVNFKNVKMFYDAIIIFQIQLL